MINLFDYFYKNKDPFVVPGRPKYLNNKGHYRKTTNQDKRHKNLLTKKRRDKNKNNKRSHKK